MTDSKVDSKDLQNKSIEHNKTFHHTFQSSQNSLSVFAKLATIEPKQSVLKVIFYSNAVILKALLLTGRKLYKPGALSF